MSSTVMLDPTSELTPADRQILPRLETLKDATVGLLDISKPRGKEFLDEIEKHLITLGATVKRYKKPTFARVAPKELNQQISVECDAVIEGLADWGSCTSCSLHDIMDLEGRGIPSGFIASCEFEQAANAQGKSLGISPARVFVAHPIQDRTDEEMVDLAKVALNKVIALICK